MTLESIAEKILPALVATLIVASFALYTDVDRLKSIASKEVTAGIKRSEQTALRLRIIEDKILIMKKNQECRDKAE